MIANSRICGLIYQDARCPAGWAWMSDEATRMQPPPWMVPLPVYCINSVMQLDAPGTYQPRL